MVVWHRKWLKWSSGGYCWGHWCQKNEYFSLLKECDFFQNKLCDANPSESKWADFRNILWEGWLHSALD